MEVRSSVEYAKYIEILCTLEISKVNQRDEESVAHLYPSSIVSHQQAAEIYSLVRVFVS